MYGDKIKTIRELRSFSQEYMADKLGICQNTYSRIETGQTKLKADILQKVAEVLGISPADILSGKPTVVNFELSKAAKELSYAEQLYTLRIEFFERVLASKESEIQLLKEVNADLLKEKKMLIELLKKQSNHSSS